MLPASISTVASPGGSWVTAAAAIRSFCSVWARSRSLRPVSRTVIASAAMAPPCTRRTSRTPFQGRQVAAYGLGGDRELCRQVGHRHPAAPGDEVDDGLLTLLRRTSETSSERGGSGGPSPICVCVVLVPNLLTVKGGSRFNDAHGRRSRIPRPRLPARHPGRPRCRRGSRARRPRRDLAGGDRTVRDGRLRRLRRRAGGVRRRGRRGRRELPAQGRQGQRRRDRGAHRQRRASPATRACAARSPRG